MSDPRALAEQIERAIVQSRLNAMAVMLVTDRAQRRAYIAQALSQLRAGAFLIGTGPSTVGIIPLTVEEVVLGRTATPLEQPADVVVDYQVADTIYLAPHEVSRVHAKVVRQPGSAGSEFRIFDLDSTCGTFVNGEPVKGDVAGRLLTTGDVISLGPAHVSTYVFCHKPEVAA